METALERLSKIKTDLELHTWYSSTPDFGIIADIKEVVTLAKANQQPTIDAIRFEAAKAAMQAQMSYEGFWLDNEDLARRCVETADALINELQKSKP